MAHLQHSIILTLSGLALLSFTVLEGELTFAHPKKEGSTISMSSDLFHDFSKEWRGEDYYYNGTGKDGFICSVLFYQLNKQERKDLAAIQKDSGVPKQSPVYAMVHFSTGSPTKEFERNEATWGDPDSAFIFRHVDIPEFQGQAVRQKNMWAYAMIGDDMYVNVHLSKVLCTPEDSIVMRNILGTLKMKP